MSLWQLDRLHLGTSDCLPFDGTLADAARVYMRRLAVPAAGAAVATVVGALVGAVWLSVQAAGSALTFGWVLVLAALLWRLLRLLRLLRLFRFADAEADLTLLRQEPPEMMDGWPVETLQFLLRSDARCAYVYVSGSDTVYVRWADSGGGVNLFSAAADPQMVSKLQDAATEEELCAVIEHVFAAEIGGAEERLSLWDQTLRMSRGKSRSGARPGRRGS